MRITVRSVVLDEGAGVPESWLALLDDEETRRWRGFRLDRDRQSFAASHALARLTLAEATGQPPRDLVFHKAATGKPYLADAVGAPFFSLSHTAGCVAVACAEQPVGIDVEALDRAVLDEGLVRLVTGRDAIGDIETFFDIWTAKEAVAKAEGLGLSLPLEDIRLSLDASHGGAASVRLPDGREHVWQLWRHGPSVRHKLALAHAGGVIDHIPLEADHLTIWADSLNPDRQHITRRPAQALSCTF